MRKRCFITALLCAVLALAFAVPVYAAGAEIDITADFGMHGLTPRGDGTYYGPAVYGNRISYNEKVYMNPCEIELELQRFDCDNDFWYAVLFNVGRNSYITSEDTLGVMIRIYRTGLEYTAIGMNGQKKTESVAVTREVDPSDTLQLKLKAEINDEQIKFTVNDIELVVTEEQYVNSFQRGAYLSIGFNHKDQANYTSEFKVVSLQPGTVSDAEIHYGSTVSEADAGIAPLLGAGDPYRTSLKVPMIILLCVGGAGLVTGIALLAVYLVKKKKE